TWAEFFRASDASGVLDVLFGQSAGQPCFGGAGDQRRFAAVGGSGVQHTQLFTAGGSDGAPFARHRTLWLVEFGVLYSGDWRGRAVGADGAAQRAAPQSL